MKHDALDVKISSPEARDKPETETKAHAAVELKPEQSDDDSEPHLFELLDVPPGPQSPLQPGRPPGQPGRPQGRGARRGWRGRAGARRIDYYYHYTRDMPLRRTKQQSFELMQQVMYAAKARLRELAAALAPYATRMAFRMAVLHGQLRQLRLDLRAVWSMAANNELLVTYPMRRLVALYSHELRKYLDVTYIVEFMLLLHHQNVKAVYKMQKEVSRANDVNTVSTKSSVAPAPVPAPDAGRAGVAPGPLPGQRRRRPHRHRPLIGRVNRRKVSKQGRI